MLKVESIEELPHPVRAMARNFLESDTKEPEIYDVPNNSYVSSEEIDFESSSDSVDMIPVP